jgi:hypothetical protein
MGHSSPGGVCGKYSAAATAARLPTHERQRLALTEESRSVGVGGLSIGAIGVIIKAKPDMVAQRIMRIVLLPLVNMWMQRGASLPGFSQ